MESKDKNSFKMWLENMDKKKTAIIAAAAVIVIAAIITAVITVNKNRGDGGASGSSTALNENENKTTGDKSDGSSEETSENGQDGGNNGDNSGDGDAENIEINDVKDDNDIKGNQSDSQLGAGAAVDMSIQENRPEKLGIDVARYQGKIDWKAVAGDGITFAMIRVGYRSTVSGEINEDPYARYNIANALANNVQVGIYFFSSAVSEAEAVEEALWVTDFISKYKITYPVAYNCEGFSESDSRQYGLTKEQRSAFGVKFLETIESKGYTPMFYASRYEMENNKLWDMSVLGSRFKVWVAWYPEKTYPDTKDAGYSGKYHMWQYTSNGKVSGISGAVDINVSYMDINAEGGNGGGSSNDSGNTGGGNVGTDIEDVTISPEANMTFKTVDETVTAKIEVNLRNMPSQDTDSRVLYTIKNGETAKRTGISESGWSRLEYGGKVCYAVSSYLTADLSKPEEETATDGETETTMRNKFTDTDDTVTAKDEVNLRTMPSATESEVVASLKNGEKVKRTGISDLGWSRVIYNGQTLYCITSYLQVTE